MKYLLMSAMLLLMSCSSVTIKHDYDSSYDFTQFKTYRWAEGKEINPDDELQKHPLIAKRVYIAVDKVLKDKGLIDVKEDEAVDLIVFAHAGTKKRTQVTQTGGVSVGVGVGAYGRPGYRGGYGGWYGPSWGGAYGGTTTVNQYDEATLVVDMVSWKDKKLVWRGIATGVVREGQSGEEQQHRLDQIMKKIFKDYPPE